jgi:SAM-dependent methyltransferase
MVGQSSIRQFAVSVVPHSMRFGLRRLVFQGRAKRCPLCGAAVRTFVAHGGDAAVLERRQVVGGMMRLNDACPVCHGADRTRLMMLYLDEVLLAGERPVRVLHFAPEHGLYLRIKHHGNVVYTAADIYPPRYRQIPELVKADLTNLHFATASFDVVICSHVLEHVPDDGKAMREIRRVLAPGGTALLMVPLANDGLGTDEDSSVTSPEDRDRLYGQFDHLRLYGRDDFAARVAVAGFDVSWFNGFDQFASQAESLWLNPRENLLIARPRAA